MKVLATDISPAMIEVAQRRLAAEPLKAGVEFRVSAIENLGKFSGKEKFDAVFSNFSGLNCVPNLAAVACDLARMTRPRAKAVFCLTNRYCVWETLWYALHGQLGRAFRRLHHNGVIARIGDGHIHVHYPSLSQITGAFAPYFSVTEIRGIGIAVPPSYLEPWARRMPAWISTGARVDRFLSRFPLLRAMGDHVAVVLERRAA
jgi:SAM-dependent methyltransferase